MEQPTLKERAEQIGEHIGDFIDAQKQLAIANATLKGSEMVSSAALGILIAFFTTIFILFGAISLGFWLATVLQSQALGFLAAGLIFLFIGILCIVLKKSITAYFKNIVVKLVYDNSNNHV